MSRNIIFYITLMGFFGLLLSLAIQGGSAVEAEKYVSGQIAIQGNEQQLFSEFSHNLQHPISILLLQILCIILTVRLFSWLAVKIRQPSVIGEIIAGIVLGPSLLGLIFPDVSTFLFPESSLPNLQFLSQIGLVLFMFIVGMELDISVLMKKIPNAVVISHASIVFPCLLGAGIAYFLYPSYAPDNIPFTGFALFMGIAMSITAFPVLARIIQERNMGKSSLGAMILVCAAADDVTAWCLLAVVIAIVKAGSIAEALITLVFLACYIMLMWYVIKPLLHRFSHRYFTRETMNKTSVTAIFVVLLMSAYMTEIIGVHALFGAFLAGIIMPADPGFRQVFAGKIEDLSLVLLLPLFFAFTGLRTQIGLLNELGQWMVCLAIIAVAVVGKFFGSAIAAKFVGHSWRDSLIIGALMNTRGLMELVVLNIGYDLGILSVEIFSMMVLMALVTTFMTSPAMDIIDYCHRKLKNVDNLAIGKKMLQQIR